MVHELRIQRDRRHAEIGVARLAASRSCPTERLTTSIGTAKPTPSPPPERDWICWLIPITRPSAPTSGPPELPGLIAASVWIAPEIAKSVSDATERSTAEMIADRQRLRLPNGDPIAATGSPTVDLLAVAQRQRRAASAPSVSTRSSATSAFGSCPSTFAPDPVAVGELDVDLLARA